MLFLRAHKKPDDDKWDNAHLLLRLLCRRSDDCTEWDVSLAVSAVPCYHFHKHRLWALLTRKLQKFGLEDESVEPFKHREYSGSD